MGVRLVLVVTASLLWAATYIYVPILSPYVERLGGTLTQAGLVLGAYGFTQLLLRLPVGILSDRLGRRRTFVFVGFAAAVASGLGLYLARTPAALMASRALAGVAATMWVALTPLFAGAWPPGQMTQAMGAAFFATSIGQTLALLGGGLLASTLGWTAPFLGAAVIAAAGMGSTLLVPEARGECGRRGGDRGGLMANPSLMAAALLAALAQCAAYATTWGFTNSQAVRLGAGPAQLGYLGIAASLPGALASLLAGRWAPRLGGHRLVAAGFAVTAAAAALVPTAAGVSWLLVLQALGSVARGIVFPILMAVAMGSVSAERRAGAMGIYQSVYALGMSVGPVLAGAAGARWGMAAVFWGTAGESGLSALLAVLLLRPARRASAW